MKKPPGKLKSQPQKAKPKPGIKIKADFIYMFIILIVFAVVYNKVYDKKVYMGGDNIVYYITAKAIADGEGYTNINSPVNTPATWYPPGYPAMSAVAMSVFGKDIEVMNVANFFYMLGSLLLLYLISVRLTRNKHLSFAISMITALNMHILKYSFIAMSEAPFIFTSLASLYFLMRMKKENIPFKDYNFWLFFIFMILSYYIRELGIVLIGSIILYLIVNKKYRLAAIIAAGFIICASPWYIRNKTVKGNRYESQIVLKNPYKPEDGKMKTADWFTRIGKNSVRYASLEIPSALLSYKIDDSKTYAKPLAGDRKWIAGIIFIILGCAGLFYLHEYKWLIFFYLAGIMAVLMLWPEVWVGIRFILILIPIIYMLVILAAYNALMWITKRAGLRENLNINFLPFVFLLYIFVLKGGITYLVNYHKMTYKPEMQNYIDTAKWAKANLSPNSVVVCRKPEIFYMFSGCKTTGYLSSVNADSLLLAMKKNKGTHVVIDELGFVSTDRYLVPAMLKYSEKFKLIYSTDKPVTNLFEINYNVEYQGEKVNGERNGKGTYRYADGKIYEGYWKNDKREGKGTIILPNGLKLEGNFSNDYLNGPGVMQLKNGNVLKATWKNDTITGIAKIYDQKGKLVEEGFIKGNNFIKTK